MLYVYALLLTPKQPLELPAGMANSLCLLPIWDDLMAVVEPDLFWEELPEGDAKVLRDTQAAIVHDRVICQLFQQASLLPLQFGTGYSSTEKLIRDLASRGSQYLAKLQQLQGKAEYTLKLVPLEQTTEAPAPIAARGRDYFLAKKQRFQSQVEQKQLQGAELEQVLQTIVATYPDTVITQSRMEEGTWKAHFLLLPSQKLQLETALQDWQPLAPQWELTLGEALPPYHFV